MKNTIRVLLLLLSVAFFVAACVNLWAEDEKFGTVSISLPTAQRSVWDQGLLGELMCELTHEITLKHSNGTTKTITTSKGATSAQIQIAPGQLLGIDIHAKYYGWDCAKGASSKTFTVVAGKTIDVDPIEMQRMPSGIVMDIERGSLLDRAIFDGQPFNETITVSNYSESAMPVTFDITGIPLAISPSGTITIAKDASVEVSFSGSSSLSDTSPYTGIIEITAGNAKYNAFTAKITVCDFDSAGIQTMIDKAKSGDTIVLPDGIYKMNSAVEIKKDIILALNLSGSAPQVEMVREASPTTYTGSFFKVIEAAFTLKTKTGTGSTVPTNTSMNLNGGSQNPTPISATASLITVSGAKGIFNMDPCVSLSNNAGSVADPIQKGGAVCVENGGAFVMSVTVSGTAPGSISGCQAEYGGGVYISADSSFIKEGDPSGSSISIHGQDNDYPYPVDNVAGAVHQGHAVYYADGPHWRDSNLLVTHSLSTSDSDLWDD